MTQEVNLATLIRQHQDLTGDSYMDIAKASGLSKAKVGQLADPKSGHMPRVDTLRRLATALRLPFEIVQRAAMVSAGVAPASRDLDNRVGLLTSRLSELSSEDLSTVEVFVLALLGRKNG